MKFFRLVSEYRWPIYIGGHLTMSVVACGVLVWVATRPDSPRPIQGYYETAQSWDVDGAVAEASEKLGWTVRYELPDGIPLTPGMPRPVDVTVTDRGGQPVAGLTGALIAVRPSDQRLNQRGTLVALPGTPGHYRTLIRMDAPGAWDFRLDARQQSLHFVHAARLHIATVTEVAAR